MSWTSAVVDATALKKIFGRDTPNLCEVCVHEIVLSRDGPQVAIRFDLPSYPAEPPRKWKTQGFNTVQVVMTFVGVRDISLTGFSADVIADIGMTRIDEVQVSIDSPRFRLRLSADAAVISKISAYTDG